MTKHTPGPWKPYFYESPRGAGRFWGVGTDGVGLLGICIHCRSKADARLIAAAPQLAEALRACLPSLNTTQLTLAEAALRAAGIEP